MGTETPLSYLFYLISLAIKIIKTPHGDGNILRSIPSTELLFLIKIIKTPHGDGNSRLLLA